MLFAPLVLLSACCLLQSAPTATLGPTTGSFLGAGDFDGGYDGRTKDTNWGGHAYYVGRIVFLNLPRKSVQDVLNAAPSTSLHLAANHSATPNLHPVILMIGRQTNTAFVEPPGWTVPVGNDYNELILLIPFVQQGSSGTRWHNYVVHIYLDDFWAMWVGNQYYGLHKEQAVLTDNPPDYDVYRETDHVFHATFTALGALTSNSMAATLPNFQAAKEILSMPVLGTITSFPGNPYVCCYFEMDYSSGDVQPISSQVEFLEEFEPGMSAWKTANAIPSVADGAFEIRNVRWRMAFPPLSCQF